VQTVFFNKLESEENRKIEDLSRREMVILAPLCALMIILGWNPTPVLERMEPSVRAVIERVESASAQASLLEEQGPDLSGDTTSALIETGSSDVDAVSDDPTADPTSDDTADVIADGDE
jgi:hypothetical protein